MTLRELAWRIRSLVAYRRRERDLDDEVIAHLELLERDALDRGLSPAAARDEARRSFGGELRMREDHRGRRGLAWCDAAMNDLRHALAALSRSPQFALPAIGVLALGIGATTAVYSLVDAVILRPLPFPEPDRIVRVWETPAAGAVSATTTSTFLAIKAQSRSFEALSAESFSTATVEVGGRPVRWAGRYVSADHFDVYGVKAVVGRMFTPDEDRAGAAPVVILSHAAWVEQFGGESDVVGRALRLDGVPHEVIGVLPAGPFDRERGHAAEAPAVFWRLNQFSEEEARWPAHWLRPVGRLAPGITPASALAELQAIRTALAPEIPAWKRLWGVAVEPLQQSLVGDRLRSALLTSMGAVALVSLLACGSVANLLLARSAARRREIAVRAALGASQGRLAAQLLSECLVLSAAGTLCGLGLAYACLQLAVPLLPPLPFTASIALDGRVLVFAASLAALVVFAVGVLPSLVTRPIAATVYAARGATASLGPARRMLVLAQVAVSVVLVCGSVLLAQSLRRLQGVDIGTRTADVMTMSIDLPRDRYPTAERLTGFYTDLVDRLTAAHGVAAASVSADLPLEGASTEQLRAPGSDVDILVRFKRVDDAYFHTLDIPVAAGRSFTREDRLGSAPVAIVNEVLAAQLSRRGLAPQVVGAVVDLPLPGFAGRRAEMRVVGVVGTERVTDDLRAAAEPVAYVSLAQHPRLQVKLAVHGADAPALLPAVREVLSTIDPAVAVADARTVDQVWQTSLSGVRGPAWLVGGFAAAALLVAALGLYGLLSQTVEQRRREIGIRMALGARPAVVAADVGRSAAGLVAGGLGVGYAGAAIGATTLSAVLFDTSPTDPTSFALAGLTVVAVVAAVAVGPLRRTTQIDPATTLRSEG